MKKTFLLFLLFLCANVFSQDLTSILSKDELATFNSLPENVKQRLLSRVDETNFTTIDGIPDPTDTVLPKIADKKNNSEFKNFGYDLFSGIATSFSPINDVPVPNDYIIGPRDRIEIFLKGEKNTSYEIEVNNSGKIFIPEIGDLSVTGLTFKELKERIDQLFESLYVNIQASISLSELKFINVYLLGLANEPGSYLVNPFTTISNLLSQAGGVKEIGSLRKVKHISKGETNYIDLYDMLIFGDRSNDMVLKNGDTVFIEPVQNVVLVNGAVKRPARYEVIENETLEEIIYLAQNYTDLADLSKVEVTEIIDNTILSTIVEDINYSPQSKLLKIRVPKLNPYKNQLIKIYGNVSEEGPYDIGEYDSLGSLISNLNFNENIHPYFAVLETLDNDGIKRAFIPFSLADSSTLKNIELKEGSNIYFFNRNHFFNYDPINFEYIPPQVKKILESYQVSFSGQFLQTTDIPVFGKANYYELVDYIGGYSPNAFINQVEIVFPRENKTVINPTEDFILDSPINVSVNVPGYGEKIIEVSINGEVNRQGTYKVLAGTTLDTLYKRSGGLKDTASSNAVIFQRKSILEQENIALEIARSDLINAFVDNIANAAASSSNILSGDLLNLISSSFQVKPTGRLVGDLSPNSSNANDLILNDGDNIFVPTKPQLVSVTGEVNNPSTSLYDGNLKFKEYIKLVGGYTSTADKRNIYVIRADGTSITVNSQMFSLNQYVVQPGDTIIVPKEILKLSGLPLVESATQIISNIAFSAASLNAIQN